ncbi:hypothetical protein GIB67_034415 [Kingdonia uniflora]|uniref:Uncharacterized protein n=1 Tax=Kingdonia uniflora TaxID=39325 RepID=A0A7J7NSF3_9MAGN|nr:hypothetical protein GIB67_034415 [Kingdonia uniflora]
MSSEMSRLGLDLCSLSTRALQRLRNAVALDRWLHHNIESIISMYEGHFDLWTFQIQPLERPDINQTEERSWWKKLIFNKRASTLPSLCSIAIKQLPIPVKRTMELRALSGWRYYFSLFLEFSDITMPFVRSAVAKISSAISFFLAYLRVYRIGHYDGNCVQDIERPYVGGFVANDPQRRLALLKQGLPTGMCPHGFLGFAVNMINLESINLSCLTINGHGLRETLFYSLFSRVQVYKTRSEMQLALPCISEGALYQDGEMVRSNGVFSLGNR